MVLVFGLSVVAAIGRGCDRRPEAPAARCLPERLLELNLDAWRRALQAADSEAEAGRLLARAGLRPTSTNGEVSLEILDARLSPPGPTDKIVQVRFEGLEGAEALRVAVLRPVGSRRGTYCSLGDDLSHDKLAGEEPCIKEYAGPARRLSLTQIIAPDRDTIVVNDTGGWCAGGGGDRGDEFSVEYWGVEDGRLVRYFGAITYEAWFRAPSPPSQTTVGTVSFDGPWPKRLSYTKIIECGVEEDGAAGECQPFEETTIYDYRRGRYRSAR